MVTQCPYWTPELIRASSEAESFEELAEIALKVLKAMPQPASQLCGPITTGGFECRVRNEIVFRRAINRLRRYGYNPFDQMPLQAGMVKLSKQHSEETGEDYCTPILEIVYERIFQSGMIEKTFFLQLWETSRGSNWERVASRRHKIRIVEFPLGWYEEILEEIKVGAAA